jgi:F-type H+-transporting ATPase subunit epsilon
LEIRYGSLCRSSISLVNPFVYDGVVETSEDMANAGQANLHLDVVTPTRLVVSERVTEVVAPGSEGYFGVLPDHIPFITTLKAGTLTYWKGKDEHHLAVARGYAEVRGDRLSVLADAAEAADEIDVARAERARERAERRLAEWASGSDSVDFARAQAALQRALARLEVAGKSR